MIDDVWVREHFDYVSDDLAHHLHGALARARRLCPVTHSDARGGYWVVTKYEDVLRIAQNWETFSSQLGVSIPDNDDTALSIPEHIDPPLHREYKRLISAYFTPTVVAQYEDRTRALVHGLIDGFIEKGECDFQEEFAVPFPARAFFEFVLNAPSDEVVRLGQLSTAVTNPTTPDVAACYKGLTDWIDDFLEHRQSQPARGDVVDAVRVAQIEGRPITYPEVQAIILLLILGGLETTTGALGQIMIRFCREPEIPQLLRDKPELIPEAVEELLRLEGPFIAIGRTVRHETQLNGCPVMPGEKVLISWASANRDEDEFPDSDKFDLDRDRNRHLAFGAGPHRCAGSSLARLNLRIAVEAMTQRILDP
ncbi:MAG TPA: cytochrome P450, partial [Acidimicrobiales bacterium]|nr:cytochrome P450 [Acidimicrobiales bacterium]